MKTYGLLLISVFCTHTVLKSQGFINISGSVGVHHFAQDPRMVGGGLAFFDYDNDGDEDLYLCGGLKQDVLLKNDGNGNFSKVTGITGFEVLNDVFTHGVAIGDIDNDGYRDVFITTDQGFHDYLFLNNGDGSFTDISAKAGFLDIEGWNTSASFGDYDLDGLLDLYVCSYVELEEGSSKFDHKAGIPNNLYQNKGGGTFEKVEVPDQKVRSSLASAFTDANGDGYPDIFVANDFGIIYGPNALYINNLGVSFDDVSVSANVDKRILGMGVGVGDYNKDGDLDYYLSNGLDNLLHRKRASAFVFDEVAKECGVNLEEAVSWGSVFFDFDNDTFLDLAVANGGVFTGEQLQNTYLFHGTSRYIFDDVSQAQNVVDGISGRGIAVSDIDNDGDLDFAVSSVHHQATSGANFLLFRNDNESQNNWLKVKLEGVWSNKDALGVWVTVVIGEERLIREIDGGGGGYLSQSTNLAHFGLGKNEKIDSLIIRWNSDYRQVFTGVIANRTVAIPEDQPANQVNDYSICEFDSMRIGNIWRNMAGNYYDTIQNDEYDLVSVVLNKLKVNPAVYDTTEVTVGPGEEFMGQVINDDTYIVERTQPDNRTCKVGQVYNVRVARVTSVSPVNSQKVQLFPNPVVTGEFTFKYELSRVSDVSFRLIDIKGVTIRYLEFQDRAPGSYEMNINIRDVPPGVYIAVYTLGEIKKSYKIIIGGSE